MSFNAIRKNKILPKISAFTVTVKHLYWHHKKKKKQFLME